MSSRTRLLRVLAGLAGAVALAGSVAAATTASAAPVRQGTAAAAPVPENLTEHATDHGHPGAHPTYAQAARLRAATARYHDISVATDAGYGLFHDTAGLACIAMPGKGGMGVHWVNGALVGDPAITPTKPEALVYARDGDGTLRLAAVEYIVDKVTWDATHARRPELFRGAPFDLIAAPNRYGLPAFYAQHVWVWKHNPAGTLAMWNPRVTCPA